MLILKFWLRSAKWALDVKKVRRWETGDAYLFTGCRLVYLKGVGLRLVPDLESMKALATRGDLVVKLGQEGVLYESRERT